MRKLPSGTVTLLFTDIEGSTRLLHELGERYADMLAEHRRMLREAFSRHGGVEVDTQGDAFFVVFARAGDAVLAAGEAQDAVAAGPVRVRIGIHTGEPAVTATGYVGIDVHRAARIMAAGHGGQVLLSETTASLLDSMARLRDLGEHRFKDLGSPERVFQVGDETFPPLRTLYRTNLPIQSTPLIGRERELEEAGLLLRSHRLVTLTGPGGSGKTRLALQLAAEAVEDFPEGVFWVSLQALRDPSLVEHAIGASVGADSGLIEHVANKRLLVLLDNFEQVVEAAPTLASVLAGTPNAKMLVTSREPLHIESEQRYPVEPLLEDDAAVLFVERARAVVPEFPPTPLVGEICLRLDRLPLAIELAAANVALLDPDELLARLDRRLQLLASRSRDAPARQRTLRAAIEWSYDLLEPDEKELFRRLAVFQGSFSLEAAEAVCGADLDILHSLVVKSLVRRWASSRLGMLETIREYAAECLDKSDDGELVRERHAMFFLERAERTENELFVGDQKHALDWFEAEHDNLRGALDWLHQADDSEFEHRLAHACRSFWSERGHWTEARRRLEEASARPATPMLRSRVLGALGRIDLVLGDRQSARALGAEAVALARLTDDRQTLTAALISQAVVEGMHGDRRRELDLYEEARRIARETGDERATATVLHNLGNAALDQRDLERARAYLEEGLEIARRLGRSAFIATALGNLGFVSLAEGAVDEAKQRFRESLQLCREVGLEATSIWALEGLVAAAVEEGDHERAATLAGAVRGARNLLSSREDAGPVIEEIRSAALASAQKHLADRFDTLFARGAALAAEEAVELALKA